MSFRRVLPEWHSTLSHNFSLMFEFFRLVVSGQGIENGLEFAIHGFGKLVKGEADAVIGHTVLGKVIGTDFFAAIAAAYLRLALFGQGLLLLFHLHLVEP